MQLVPTRDREAVGHMLTMNRHIDVIVPRGGKALIERVMNEARIPVIAHLEGLCHTYVHRAADRGMAKQIVLNAKMRRPGVCGATETLLVDRAVGGHASAGDPARPAQGRLRGARHGRRAEAAPARRARDRAGLVDRVSRRDPRR